MKKLSALSLLALGLCLIPAVDAAAPKATPQTAPKTSQPAAAKATAKTTTKVDPKAAAKVDPKATAKVDPKAAKDSAAAEQPIVGILIERKNGSGGFLNLKIDAGNFVITFLDKDKKEIEGDLSRAIIRFRKSLKNNQYILRRSADGKSLRATGAPVARPYILPALPVILFKEGQEEVAESYVVQFKQPMPDDGKGIPADEMTPEQLEKIAK